MVKTEWRCGASRDLPVNTTRSWDGGAAAKRMLDAAGIGSDRPKPEIAKRGFLLYDAGNLNLRGSYKLPFADRIEGRLTAIAAGIRNAASRLPQTDAPPRERDRARQIIDHYEKRMADAKEKNNESADGSGLRRRPSAHRLAMVGTKLFEVPLALHPTRGAAALCDMAARIGLRSAGGSLAMGIAADGDDDDEEDAAGRGYDVRQAVAVIDIEGVLVDGLGCLRPFWGMTGYDGIRANITAALADPQVRAVALNIDSPGGDCSGCFDLADWIFAQRGRKPIWAILNDAAYSAAYALASSTDRVLVPQAPGGVGSIGVIAVIPDLSKALENAGIAINVIQFGTHKTDGLELLPMSDDARAGFQADVNLIGERFVSIVARNRKLDAAAVRATEADGYLGAEAVSRGLADAVAAPDQAFAALVRSFQQEG